MGTDSRSVRRHAKAGTKDKLTLDALPMAVERHAVIIVGAGFSGINMAIRLQQSGVDDVILLERAGEAGGTWRDNVYPGCACDVPSVLYSYSFEQYPDWTRSFAGSEEIQQYVLHCVAKYGIRPRIRFGREVQRAVFDESAGEWEVTDSEGQVYRARAVVSAVGGLVNPSIPDIPGMKEFKGTLLHTARWDRNVDLRGKRVAVLGTGASAVQVIPSIQPIVKSLTVFQRTPAWVVPKPDFAMPASVRSLFKLLPATQRLARNGVFLLSEAVMGPAIVIDTPMTSLMQSVASRHIKRSISDPELRRKVTPNFRFGCKRMLVSNDYYPALASANTTLNTDTVAAFDADGIVMKDGTHHAFDVIVLATGFRLDIGRAPFEVLGAGGESLDDAWHRPGGKAYKGISVAGFPNWFVLLGPNTGPGHTSVLVYTEAQVEYTLQAIDRLLHRGVKTLSVKPQVQKKYGEKLQSRMKYTNWKSGCTSWYLDANGENHSLFPGLVSEYVLSIRKFRDADYDIDYDIVR